jgi:hypothetical protein
VNQTALEAVSLGVAIALWWLGIRKIALTTPLKSILSALELGLLIASVVALRWTGLAIFVAANVVGLLLYSVRLAMRQETILVEIANRTGSSKEEVEASHRKLGQQEHLKWVGPIERAEWMREIAYRGRSLEEIEYIAPTIGALALIYGQPDPKWLIAKFDQILRLYDEPASRAEAVAETIYASVKASAATFPEMIEALITAVSPMD